MRPYERTHRWISFEFDLRRINSTTWLQLGEAQSKCEHIAGVPLRPDTAASLHSIYLAKGALATTAIEGNTLTEEEVRKRIEGKLDLPASKQYLGQEIDNIVRACNEIAANLEHTTDELTPKLVSHLNEIVLTKVPAEEHVVPGKVRTVKVGVARYDPPLPEDCEYLLERMCGWLNHPDLRNEPTNAIAFAIVRSVLAHIYLAWIHPFGDGNGRTARLIEFYMLIHAGVPLPAAHLLSDHYNRTRSEYYRQLHQASLSGGDVLPFLQYAVAGFVDGLKDQLARIREQQWDVAWRNYVHEGFRDKKSLADERRRHLALDLSLHHDGVPVAKIATLSPRLAAAYATKQQKTVSRDLNVLMKMGLIERVGHVVRAKRERILAFLPVRRISKGHSK